MLGLEDMQILQISLSLKVLALLRENEENVADSLNVVSNLILELGKYAPEFPFRGIVQHFLTALIPELTNTSQNLKLDGKILQAHVFWITYFLLTRIFTISLQVSIYGTH